MPREKGVIEVGAVRSWLKTGYRAVDGSLQALASARKGRIANNYAHGQYKKLLANSGIPPLSTHIKKRISDYSRDVFRSPYFTGHLRFYSAFRGEFLEGWIPENFFVSFALPQINHAYRFIGGSGTLARRILQGANLPDIAYRIGDAWFDQEFMPIRADDISQHLFADSDRVILKCETSLQGRGIRVFERGDFDPRWMHGVNVVAQHFIRPAAIFAEISPGGFMTLRVTTWSRNGSLGFVASHFRVVRSGDQFVQSGSKLLLYADRAGALSTYGWDNSWRKFSRHPDLGSPFAGFIVPKFDRAVELALHYHRGVPQFGVIGWDFVVPENGDPILIEWNTQMPGTMFHEASVGPCLAPLELERLVDAGHTY